MKQAFFEGSAEESEWSQSSELLLVEIPKIFQRVFMKFSIAKLPKRLYSYFVKAPLSNSITIALIIFIVVKQAPQWFAHSQLEGTLIREISLKNSLGEDIKLPNGAAAVYIFWATWCGPCHFEMERFQSAVNEGTLDRSKIFAVNMGEEPDAVRSFWQEKKYPFQLVFDPNEKFAKEFEVTVTPTVIFMESSNTIGSIVSGISIFNIWRAQYLLKSPNLE